MGVQAGSFDDFVIAVRNDDAMTVEALLGRGFDPNTLDEKLTHPLISAVQQDSLKVAELLVRAPKTNLNQTNEADENALMMAALRGHADLVNALIEHHAQVNKTGWTPLHYAATGGHVDIIRSLLEASAYIDAESPNGTTPLMMAGQYANASAVKVLLEAGADPTIKNQLGLSALDFARNAERADSAAIIEAFAKGWRK